MPTATIARTLYVEINGATGVPTGFVYTPEGGKFTLDATSVAALGLKDLKNASGSKYRIAVNALQTSTQGFVNNPILPTDGSYVLHHSGKRITGVTLT